MKEPDCVKRLYISYYLIVSALQALLATGQEKALAGIVSKSTVCMYEMNPKSKVARISMHIYWPPFLKQLSRCEDLSECYVIVCTLIVVYIHMQWTCTTLRRSETLLQAQAWEFFNSLDSWYLYLLVSLSFTCPFSPTFKHDSLQARLSRLKSGRKVWPSKIQYDMGIKIVICIWKYYCILAKIQ